MRKSGVGKMKLVDKSEEDQKNLWPATKKLYTLKLLTFRDSIKSKGFAKAHNFSFYSTASKLSYWKMWCFNEYIAMIKLSGSH